MAKTESEIQDIREREQGRYLELNNLTLEKCLDIDLENIAFNVEYELAEAKCTECGWEGVRDDCGFGHNDVYCPACGKESIDITETTPD